MTTWCTHPAELPRQQVERTILSSSHEVAVPYEFAPPKRRRRENPPASRAPADARARAQDSYFIAETVKYLYLLFDDSAWTAPFRDPARYIFNTEVRQRFEPPRPKMGQPADPRGPGCAGAAPTPRRAACVAGEREGGAAHFLLLTALLAARQAHLLPLQKRPASEFLLSPRNPGTGAQRAARAAKRGTRTAEEMEAARRKRKGKKEERKRRKAAKAEL